MQPIGESKTPQRQRAAIAFGALGLGLASIVGCVWAVRLPLAQAAGEAYLRQNGIEARLRVRALSLSRVALEHIRLGRAAAPDFAADRLEIGITWRGLSPRLSRVLSVKPRLTGRWAGDRLSFGSLDRLLVPADGQAKPFALPPLGLEIREAELRLESPLGLATLSADSQGVLGQDFSGTGTWRLRAAGGEITGPFTLRADASGLAATLRGSGTAYEVAGVRGSGPRLRAEITSDLELKAVNGRGEIFSDALQGDGSAINQPALRFEGGLDGPSGAQMRWRARADLSGAAWRASALQGGAFTAKLALDGTAASGGGRLDALAQDLAGPGFTAAKAQISGPLAAKSLTPLRARADLSVQAMSLGATGPLRAALRASIAGLAEGPLQDFAKVAAPGLDAALAGAALRAEPAITLDPHGAAITFAQPPGIFAQNGAALIARPTPDGIVFGADGSLRAAGALEFFGPGLPKLELNLKQMARSAAGAVQAQGEAQLLWRAGRSQISLSPTGFAMEFGPNGRGHARADGRLEADVRSQDFALLGLRFPVNGTLAWGGATRLSLAEPGCAAVRAARLEAGGLRLDAPTLALCAPAGALFDADQNGARGGFRLDPTAWRGTLDGQPLTLEAGAITGAWSGGQSAPHLRLTLPRARLQQQAGLTAGLGNNRLDLVFGPQFSASGRLENGSFAQASLPTGLSQLGFDWSFSPKGELAVRAGTATLRAAAAEIAAHQPILLSRLALAQDGSRLTGSGRAELIAPKVLLGEFTLNHDLDTAAGHAQWQTRELTFSPALQPFEISETLRGVVELARGAISAEAIAEWRKGVPLAARGEVELQGLSFSTLALGPIDGVNGQIIFDDLLAMTTPPNQTVTVAKINPGLPVEQGSFIFQLEPKSMLRLQSASWPYAKGVLSIDPTRVQLGGEITTFNLRLSKVDLPALLDQLSLSESIRATGIVEGEFPLVFSPAGGRIENGHLAAVGAGLIAMQSPALDQTVAQSGAASQAGSVGLLQALQGFSYDELALRNVSGAIDGEITADIVFAGENVAPVSLPIPGGKNLIGLPYRFKVTVKAPLLQLSRSAQNALDYKGSIAQALELEQQNAAPPETSSPN